MTEPLKPDDPHGPAQAPGPGGHPRAAEDPPAAASHGPTTGTDDAAGADGADGTDGTDGDLPPWGAPEPGERGWSPTYGPTHAATYGPLFPPTPPFGVHLRQQQERRALSPLVKALVGAAIAVALLVTAGPVLGLVDFLPGGRGVETTPPVSSAEWDDIVRDPTAHAGRRLVVYARLTEHPTDGVTSINALAGPRRLDDPAGYTTPVVLTVARGWKGFRDGDEVRLDVTVRGAYPVPGGPLDLEAGADAQRVT